MNSIATANAASNRPFIAPFHGLRGIAVLYVVASHVLLSPSGYLGSWLSLALILAVAFVSYWLVEHRHRGGQGDRSSPCGARHTQNRPSEGSNVKGVLDRVPVSYVSPFQTQLG
jgi:peptidoglycan/LPS O-acetylase OafA/YrhL